MAQNSVFIDNPVPALTDSSKEPPEYIEELCSQLEIADQRLQSFVQEPNRRTRLHKEFDDLNERCNSSEDRSSLFGMPVGIKDIIHVDGLETRAGSALPPELFSGPEAACVGRLREAGAFILGKTVTTEFAGEGPGLTRNPHNLNHTPGGSSSGSAAAVAAGLCPLALGTQTGGSVIRPAAYCGIVGMKPTFKRIPRAGVIERSKSADHVGMFTPDVNTMESAASVLCDDWDNSESKPTSPPTIGVPQGTYLDHASEQAIENYEKQLEQLAESGCEIKRVPVPEFENFEELDKRHLLLTEAELIFVHQSWFDDFKPFYRTRMAERIERGRSVDTGRLAECRESQTEFRNELEHLLEKNDIDLWAAPAAPGPAPETIQSTGNPVMNRPWTHSGLPVITLPAGTADNGLPLGIQFISSFMADESLIAWSKLLEPELSNG